MGETIAHRRNRMEKESLFEIGYKYLHDNFHKFSEANKIKIALEMVKIEKAKPLIDQSKHTHFTVVTTEKDLEKESNGRLGAQSNGKVDAETELRL